MKILIEESVLRQALDELCTQRDAHYSGDYPIELRESITALRTALDAAEADECQPEDCDCVGFHTGACRKVEPVAEMTRGWPYPSDEKLLKLAAKAAGIEHPGGDHSIANDGRLWDCNALRWWNPLTDDGDALRLAIDLRMDFFFGGDANSGGEAFTAIPAGEEDGAEEFITTDPYAETRRAIVRAAAEIGKGMK